MPRTGAQNRGIQRERALKRFLEEQGWWVGRAAGSLGDADLIALRDGSTPMLIEVKSTKTPFSGFGPADRVELLTAALRAGAEAWLAWWPADRKGCRWIPAAHWPSTPHAQEVA